MNALEVNVLVLAYLGDTIYENYIRRYLIHKGIGNVNDLQKEAIQYVSAKAQARFLNHYIEKGFFTEEEITVVKRARNYKVSHHPKNCDILTYKHATGLEALIGYLDLLGKQKRIEEIMEGIIFTFQEDSNLNKK